VIPVLDLEAPILPGIGIGGFLIGRNIGEYRDLLTTDSDGWNARVHGLWQVVYRVDQIWDWTEEEEQRAFRVMQERSARLAGGNDAPDVWAPARPEGPPVLEVWADVRDGTVTTVVALEGYRGALPNGVGIGTPFREIVQEWPDAYHDGLVVRTPSEVGVVLYLGDPDPEPEELKRMSVQAIGVFDGDVTDSGILPY
jgi:hypothetical protein